NLPVVRAARQLGGDGLRRSQVQAARGPGGPGGRHRVALEGRRQLLRRPRQRAREQRLALLHRERPPQHAEVRRRARAAQRLAHAARRVRRVADPGRAGRKDVYRAQGQSHRRRGRGRLVDQGRQRDLLRRLQLRLHEVIRLVLAPRALRAFADGFIAVVLPAYLLALGLDQLQVGLIGTATLFGSALTTLAVGRWGHRYSIRRMLLVASVAMAVTGCAFAGLSSLWPLLVVAFIGTLNPSSGDATVFLPLDHTMLATTPAERRTTGFARYSFTRSGVAPSGALVSGAPEWLASQGWSMLTALRAMFLVYAAIGVTVWLLYFWLPDPHAQEEKPAAPLGPSRGIVWRMAGLFSVDSFAGGLILNSLLALWLFPRFGMSFTPAG